MTVDKDLFSLRRIARYLTFRVIGVIHKKVSSRKNKNLIDDSTNDKLFNDAKSQSKFNFIDFNFFKKIIRRHRIIIFEKNQIFIEFKLTFMKSLLHVYENC